MADFKHMRDQATKSLEPALQWYRARDPREQQVLRLLAVFLVLALFYLLVLQPLWSARDHARQQYVEAAQTLDWIQANSGAIEGARKQSAASGQSSGDWVSHLSSSASQHNLQLKGFSPDGDNKVRISLEGQPFSRVLIWLQDLTTDNVHVSDVEFSHGARDGTVNVRATLERGV